ncbi:MAG: phage holin family protein [Candidatus Eremiobacteraeota bacterium]|nr:phage holin family protein [Candidatus Eremiobacteraeota bacterium]MBV8365275.1 phage holin family protein [Candidatus Eremiobacteraeota bacterium]
MHLLTRFIINALAVLAISYWPWHIMGIHSDGWLPAVEAAIVLGIANAIIRPILMVLSCPLIILTLGIGTLFINALIFYYGLRWIPGFTVPGFWPAFWGALVVTIISWILSLIIREPEDRTPRQQTA